MSCTTFIFMTFFIWNYIILQKFVQSFDILKFKIQTVQTKSVEKMTNMKVVDLDELHNFVFDIFCIWNHLLSRKSIWIPNSTKTITDMADPPRQTKKFGTYIPLSRAYCLTDAWDQPRSCSRSGNFRPRPRPYPLGQPDKRGKSPDLLRQKGGEHKEDSRCFWVLGYQCVTWNC